MSRWAETFAKLSGASDTLDTARRIGESASRVSQSVNSVTVPAQPSKPLPPPTLDRAPSICGEAEEECAACVEAPSLLADGRRLYRFPAHAIPLVATADAAALLDQARWYGTVLVADGRELIVVERWQSNLPPETLEAIKRNAAGIIAALRGEARR